MQTNYQKRRIQLAANSAPDILDKMQNLGSIYTRERTDKQKLQEIRNARISPHELRKLLSDDLNYHRGAKILLKSS